MATLKEAEHKVDQALILKPRTPIALGNKGYILFLQNRAEEAAVTLRAAIELGGAEVRDGELADAEISPTPLDEAFKALVRSIEIT